MTQLAVVVRRGLVQQGLSLVGIALISWAIISQAASGELSPWLMAGTLVSCASWLALVLLRPRNAAVTLTLLVVMLGFSGIAASATSGASLVVAAVAVLWLTRDLRRPVWWGAGLGVVTALVVLASGLIVPIAPLGMLSMEAGVVLGFFVGESRRQTLVAAVRSRELIEEQARADVLVARQQLAHDIHDVLAHSLGGLVIQLDAVDALLDAGEIEAAAAKAREARLLAKDGMTEARRAVAALSTDETALPDRVPGAAIVADVSALVTAHRALGGSARLVEKGNRMDVSGRLAIAVRRLVQEGLTNARKHAAGEPVTVSMTWQPTGLSVRIENPLGASAHVEGGGHGLVGMRDRFAALPGGAVTSGVDGGRFVVTAKAATA